MQMAAFIFCLLEAQRNATQKRKLQKKAKIAQTKEAKLHTRTHTQHSLDFLFIFAATAIYET